MKNKTEFENPLDKISKDIDIMIHKLNYERCDLCHLLKI